MVMKGSFEERAAHLSYVAPLIATLLVAQMGTRPLALVLVSATVAGGLFASVTGLAWSRRERGVTSRAAALGLLGNLAFAVGLVVHTALG